MKAMIVVDIPNIIEPCAIDELGFVADLHIQPTTLCDYDPFDLKDVDVRPLPPRKEYEAPTELEGFKVSQMMVMANADGWNECLDAITGETE